ncbi:hypothetical protein [Malaciobacter marinus]|uniref:hypothetical protein n=1 Tax=Malaciobacter marinus TaxID=505249 RepID=UPI003B009BDD
MDLAFFKENKYFDIIYRFVLWFSIAFFIFYISDILDNLGYIKLKSTIPVPPKSDFIQFIGVLGMFVSGVSLLVKEFVLNESHESILLYLLSKISTDLVLAPFNIMAFVLGWGYYLYTQAEFIDRDLNELIFFLIIFILLMLFLAFISLIVRAKPGEYLFDKIYTINRKIRVPFFITLVCSSAYVFTIG